MKYDFTSRRAPVTTRRAVGSSISSFKLVTDVQLCSSVSHFHQYGYYPVEKWTNSLCIEHHMSWFSWFGCMDCCAVFSLCAEAPLGHQLAPWPPSSRRKPVEWIAQQQHFSWFRLRLRLSVGVLDSSHLGLDCYWRQKTNHIQDVRIF